MTKRDVLKELLDGNKIDAYICGDFAATIVIDDSANISRLNLGEHVQFSIFDDPDYSFEKHQELMTFTEAFLLLIDRSNKYQTMRKVTEGKSSIILCFDDAIPCQSDGRFCANNMLFDSELKQHIESNAKVFYVEE